MKIICQSCQSKYNVADEKVHGKIVKIRCRKCGSTIVVNGSAGAAANGSVAAPAPTPAATSAADDAAAAQWHVNVGDVDQRTMTLAEVVEAYNTGLITQDTYIWTDGMEDWKPLAEVEVVVEALHASADQAAAAPAQAGYGYDPPAPEPPAEPQYQPQQYEVPAPVFGSPMVAQAAAEVPAAPATSAAEAKRAAVRREARGRDLFGAGGALVEEVQTSAPAVPQAATTPGEDAKLTGERNENSVLFSLAMLTKGAEDRAPNEMQTPRSDEDSGLIDLKALAAKAESTRPPPAALDGGAFVAPIGMSAPLGAPLGMLGGPHGDAQPKSKLPMLIGGGAGVVILLVLGIVIGVKIASSDATPIASSMASAAPLPSATAEPAASATASAEATASAAPSGSVAAKPKPAYHPTGGGGFKPATGAATAAAGAGAAAGGAATGGSTPTPPPPKKAGSDCGCNGDLMCLMKCSTH